MSGATMVALHKYVQIIWMTILLFDFIVGYLRFDRGFLIYPVLCVMKWF